MATGGLALRERESILQAGEGTMVLSSGARGDTQ